MKPKTVKEAAETAAEFIYNFVYELGAEREDCHNAAYEIYYEITGEALDTYSFFGDEECEGEDY